MVVWRRAVVDRQCDRGTVQYCSALRRSTHQAVQVGTPVVFTREPWFRGGSADNLNSIDADDENDDGISTLEGGIH